LTWGSDAQGKWGSSSKKIFTQANTTLIDWEIFLLTKNKKALRWKLVGFLNDVFI